MLNDVRETSPEEMRQIRQASGASGHVEPMATAADAVDGVVQEPSGEILLGIWMEILMEMFFFWSIPL